MFNLLRTTHHRQPTHSQHLNTLRDHFTHPTNHPDLDTEDMPSLPPNYTWHLTRGTTTKSGLYQTYHFGIRHSAGAILYLQSIHVPLLSANYSHTHHIHSAAQARAETIIRKVLS